MKRKQASQNDAWRETDQPTSKQQSWPGGQQCCFLKVSFLRPYCIIMILITFASVRFTGVLFVQDDVTNDDDVVGFLFGYQVPLE